MRKTRKGSGMAALLEVFGVFMVGQLIAVVLMRLLGLDLVNPIEVLRRNPDTDLVLMSKNLFVLLLLQYGGFMVPALLIGWWRRRRGPGFFGLKLTGRINFRQLENGVVLFAVAGLPFRLLPLIDRVAPLGTRAVTQEFLYSLGGRPGYWLFMAVGSFLLVPVLEEVFYRWYVQTRLSEGFGAAVAVVSAALFFTLAHGQYLQVLSPWTVGSLVSTLFLALGLGYGFLRTRSLLGPMIAHGLINFPFRGVWDFLLPALMILVVIIYRKRTAGGVRGFAALFARGKVSKRNLAFSSGVLIGLSVMVALAQEIALLFGIAALATALILGGAERRASRKAMSEQA